MKKVLFILVLAVVCSIASAQNLTLTELLSLNKKAKWEQVDSFLKKKGWAFFETSQIAGGKIVVWNYKKEKDSNRAMAWITAVITDGKPGKLSYEFGSEPAFKNIKKATLLLKMKESSTDVRQDITSVSYTNPNSWILLNTLTGRLADRLVNTPATYYAVDVYPMFGAYDKVNGSKRENYDNGSVKKEYTLRNGMVDGTVKEYYPNGKLHLESTFLMGKKRGVESVYDESGLLLAEVSYMDDIRNGEFKEYDMGKVKTVGSYVNGKKDGFFVGYDLNGSIARKYSMKGDSLHGRYVQNIYSNGLVVKTITGDYDNGLRNGYWEIAHINGSEKDVLEYTSYLLGVKDGKFREMQGDSLLIGSYKVGKFDGRLEVYLFSKDKIAQGSLNLADASEVAFYTYSNGVLNGSYERRDHEGAVMAKGNMTNGRREGEWEIALAQKDDNGKAILVFHKGSFMRDVMVGEWIAVTMDNIPIKRYAYKNGRIDGKVVEYTWRGKPIREKMIENDKLVKLSIYDSLGSSIAKVIDIKQDDATELRCKQTTYLPSGYSYCCYWMKTDAGVGASPETFEKEFTDKTVKLADATKGGPDGDYKEFNKNNEVVVEGKFERSQKVGKWKRYYYPMDIIIVTDYSYKTVVDMYLDLPTGKPYSGRFVEAYDNGQIKCEKKVYSGLLDGKVKYYNQDGRVEKEEIYSQGILKR